MDETRDIAGVGVELSRNTLGVAIFEASDGTCTPITPHWEHTPSFLPARSEGVRHEQELSERVRHAIELVARLLGDGTPTVVGLAMPSSLPPEAAHRIVQEIGTATTPVSLPADLCVGLASGIVDMRPQALLIVIDCSDEEITLSILAASQGRESSAPTRCVVHCDPLPSALSEIILNEAWGQLIAQGWAEMRTLRYTAERIEARIMHACTAAEVPAARTIALIHPLDERICELRVDELLAPARALLRERLVNLLERALLFLEASRARMASVIVVGEWRGCFDPAVVDARLGPAIVAPPGLIARGAAHYAAMPSALRDEWVLDPLATRLPEHPLQALRQAVDRDDDPLITALGMRILGRGRLPDDLLARVVFARQRLDMDQVLTAATSDPRQLLALWDGGRAFHTTALGTRWEGTMGDARARLSLGYRLRSALLLEDPNAARACLADDDRVRALLNTTEDAALDRLLAEPVLAAEPVDLASLAAEELVAALAIPDDPMRIAAAFPVWRDLGGPTPPSLNDEAITALERRLDAAAAIRLALAIGDTTALAQAWLPSVLAGPGGLTVDEASRVAAILRLRAEERLRTRGALFASSAP